MAELPAHDDGSWSYWQDTELVVLGREGTFHHTDEHHLHRVAGPTPNPTAVAEATART